jgi:hypothetical protein
VFANGHSITSSFGSGGLTEGDVDGDGDLDLFAGASSVIAWFGNRDGHADFGAPQVISVSTKRLETLHGADLDMDGDLDLLSGSGSNETVLSRLRMFGNVDGAGQFALRQDLFVDFDEVTDIDTGDLDGDGDRDVVSSQGYSGSVRWFPNLAGVGRFGPSTVLTEPSSGWADAVHLADLDGDGDLDILSGRGAQVFWIRNDVARDGAGR